MSFFRKPIYDGGLEIVNNYLFCLYKNMKFTQLKIILIKKIMICTKVSFSATDNTMGLLIQHLLTLPKASTYITNLVYEIQLATSENLT